ncbi:hypothetical protein [Rhodalgimonas zhirmunskyi]|uniref:Secreted protein n=1 Tax=Rhodalgimonas zhirmunskyi TaxID=2964767 RepID=A0AAJ1U8V1_9RHOB|nr:hypothetical protein [Rhodoalgimonas zhirmunskyi]MDQ2093423.1 hypothetical protein [Rhodoalgimonas zhirmunskyi]
MKMKRIFGAAMVAATFAGFAAPVQAQPKIYPVPSKVNYCPSGLQPITIDGVICCGTPNQNMTYQQAKAHPMTHRKVYRKKHVRRVANTYCPVGMKGCVER